MAGDERSSSRCVDFPAVPPGLVDRIDPDEFEDVWMVGDVHGCMAALSELLDRIAPTRRDLLVFVGDLVAKGPNSAAVCEFVRERENALSVRGNNEQKVLDGQKRLSNLEEADRSFLASLPVAIVIGDDLVVHGGVDGRKPLADHAVEDLLTMRSLGGGGYERPYWFEQRSEGPRVFFGHTVLSRPFHSQWAVGLDTGCVYGGALTAFNRSTGETVSVSPTETHQPRSADDIVDPRLPQTSKR